MPRDDRPHPDQSNGIFASHLFRYTWALPYAYGKMVLDAGCGSGYGADLLATVAQGVVGVDYDPEAVIQNRKTYGNRKNLTFAAMEVTTAGLADESFDLVVSFEVYEHVDPANGSRFVQELYRVCRSGGRVLLSTPNRLVEGPHMRSIGLTNPRHINSVSPRELKARLQPPFASVQLFGHRAKARPLKRLLKTLDVFNLRHRIFSRAAQERLDLFLSRGVPSYQPALDAFEVGSLLIRQSGHILAVCRK